MTQDQNAVRYTTSWYAPVFLGAALGLALVSLYLWGAGAGNPEWGSYWRIRPVLVITLAGAGGGFFYYLMAPLRRQGGWLLALGIILGLLGILVALWLGFVLGFNGTYWN